MANNNEGAGFIKPRQPSVVRGGEAGDVIRGYQDPSNRTGYTTAGPDTPTLGWDARGPVQQHWAERGMEASTPGTPLYDREQAMIAANAEKNLIRDTRKRAALASKRGQRIRSRTPSEDLTPAQQREQAASWLLQREMTIPVDDGSWNNQFYDTRTGGKLLPASRTPTRQDLIKNMIG